MYNPYTILTEKNVDNNTTPFTYWYTLPVISSLSRSLRGG